MNESFKAWPLIEKLNGLIIVGDACVGVGEGYAPVRSVQVQSGREVHLVPILFCFNILS